jgi:hypothetical protein
VRKVKAKIAIGDRARDIGILRICRHRGRNFLEQLLEGCRAPVHQSAMKIVGEYTHPLIFSRCSNSRFLNFF